jgi:hypothetical protein
MCSFNEPELRTSRFEVAIARAYLFLVFRLRMSPGERKLNLYTALARDVNSVDW